MRLHFPLVSRDTAGLVAYEILEYDYPEIAAPGMPLRRAMSYYVCEHSLWAPEIDMRDFRDLDRHYEAIEHARRTGHAVMWHYLQIYEDYFLSKAIAYAGRLIYAESYPEIHDVLRPEPCHYGAFAPMLIEAIDQCPPKPLDFHLCGSLYSLFPTDQKIDRDAMILWLNECLDEPE